MSLVSCGGDKEFDEDHIILSAQLLSDEHTSRTSPVNADELFKKALNNFKELSKQEDYDVYISAGDHTMTGQLSEQNLYLDSLIEIFPNANYKLFDCQGNHDVAWASSASRAEIYNNRKANYHVYDIDSEESDAISGNRHAIINGLHFFALDIANYSPNHNTISAETEAWFNDIIWKYANELKSKPFFVIAHSPAKNTVFGSYDRDSTGIWGSSKSIDSLLSHYPNAIYLSGHTHYPCINERSIYQDKYSAIQLPSVSGGLDMDYYFSGTNEPVVDPNNGQLLSERYIYNALDGGQAEAYIYAQGLLMEVDKNYNTRFTRYNLKDKEIIKPGQEWIIPAPKDDKSHLTKYRFDTRHDINQAPHLKEGDAITLSYDSINKKYSIFFPSLEDDDYIYAYDAQLFINKNKEQLDDKSIPDERWMILDEWYKYSSPNTRRVNFSYTFNTVIEPDDEIVIRLIAFDVWYDYVIVYPS